MKEYVVNFLIFFLNLLVIRVLNLFDFSEFIILWVFFFIFLILFQFFFSRGKFFYFLYLATIFISSKAQIFEVFSGYNLYYSDTPSNYPTIENDDLVVGRRFKINYERGEMVSFETNFSSQDFVKRIHGIPGDHIKICNNEVYVNEYSFKKENNWEPLKFSDGKRCSSRKSSFFLKENEYFVLGDNAKNSFDSRNFGPIMKNKIISNKIYIVKGNDYNNPVFLKVVFLFPK